MKHIKILEEYNTRLNESIEHGVYYFNEQEVPQELRPVKDQTKYGVVSHNTVELADAPKGIAYISVGSSMGQNFNAAVMFAYETEKEAVDTYKNLLKSGKGAKPGHLSFAYGTLNSKGRNIIFEEIGGERKVIK